MSDKYDDIINPKTESLEDKFAKERLEWSEKITEINSRMKNIVMVAELMTSLYTERQRAVEYYHYLFSLLIGINRKYNASYAERHEYYTHKIQVRYPNETVKHNRILVDLADQVEKREIMNNHIKFIEKTIATLDNIIYAIPKRVEIENILRGK